MMAEAHHFLTNLSLQATEKKGAANFEELLRAVEAGLDRDNIRSSWESMKGEAKLCKARKTATDVQFALLLVIPELNAFVDCLACSAEMLYNSIDDRGLSYPEDFPAFASVVGVTFSRRTGFSKVSVKDSSHANLHLEKTAFFVGRSEAGKSAMQRALGRFFGELHGKPNYIFGSSIDPLGLLTRGGVMTRVGAVMLADVQLVTLMNTPLTETELKGLLLPYEAAHIRARYHKCILPENVPRTISLNVGSETMPNDPGAWFDCEGLPALGCMARGDLQGLQALGDPGMAIARRAVIFMAPDDGFGGATTCPL